MSKPNDNNKQYTLGNAASFKLGMVVVTKNHQHFGNVQRFGHVIGYSANPQGDICIDVQCPTDTAGEYYIRSFHPTNLTILK